MLRLTQIQPRHAIPLTLFRATTHSVFILNETLRSDIQCPLELITYLVIKVVGTSERFEDRAKQNEWIGQQTVSPLSTLMNENVNYQCVIICGGYEMGTAVQRPATACKC